MARLMMGAFISWELSEQEEEQGAIFTETQLHVLQNQLSGYANQAITLEVDPVDGVNAEKLYFLRKAELQAQIKLLRYLIAKSEDNKSTPLSAVENLEDLNPDYQSPFGDERAI